MLLFSVFCLFFELWESYFAVGVLSTVVMPEVPVDFEVEIERESGDGRSCIDGADELKKSEGINGISQDDPSLSSSGNIHCFREED